MSIVDPPIKSSLLVSSSICSCPGKYCDRSVDVNTDAYLPTYLPKYY